MKKATSTAWDAPPRRFLLRARRVNLGLSQEELSRRSGVSAVTIGKLERGRDIRMKTFYLLAPHLELTVAEMLQMFARQRDHDPAANEP